MQDFYDRQAALYQVCKPASLLAQTQGLRCPPACLSLVHETQSSDNAVLTGAKETVQFSDSVT